jgi:hypothetical protein
MENFQKIFNHPLDLNLNQDQVLIFTFKTSSDLNSLPKHLRTENQPKETSEEEEMKKLAKERMEKLKKQLNENENDEL